MMPTLPVTVEGERVVCMVDPGASNCVVDEQTARDLKLPIKEANMRLALGNKQTHIVGEALATLHFPGGAGSLSSNFWVLPNKKGPQFTIGWGKLKELGLKVAPNGLENPKNGCKIPWLKEGQAMRWIQDDQWKEREIMC
jgi:hypothetical protein